MDIRHEDMALQTRLSNLLLGRAAQTTPIEEQSLVRMEKNPQRSPGHHFFQVPERQGLQHKQSCWKSKVKLSLFLYVIRYFLQKDLHSSRPSNRGPLSLSLHGFRWMKNKCIPITPCNLEHGKYPTCGACMKITSILPEPCHNYLQMIEAIYSRRFQSRTDFRSNPIFKYTVHITMHGNEEHELTPDLIATHFSLRIINSMLQEYNNEWVWNA